MNNFQSQLLPTSQSLSTIWETTPDLQYPLLPILFMASPEPIASSSQRTLQPQAIPSHPPSPILLLPNLELMEPQVEMVHPLLHCTSPDCLCALANLGGGQLEIMVWELVRYPNRSLHEIYPWDHDCLVRAVLSQAGTALLYLSIVEGDDYFMVMYHNLPHLLPLQQQCKEMMEIEIAPWCLHLMNLKKVYPQSQMPLPMETVHLAETQTVIPFWIQVGETGAETSICTLRYTDEIIGQAYEAARWAFPATTKDCKPFTVHNQGWEILDAISFLLPMWIFSS